MLKWIALLFCAPAAFAYTVLLFPPGEFSKSAAEELAAKWKITGLLIEDFEDDQLVEGLRTTLSPNANDDAAQTAWDGQRGSEAVNAALFEFDPPGARFFGVGLADNDFGTETLSINGGWQLNLNTLPNYQANGQGKGCYLVVVAGENDPDLWSISIANGLTIVFDHLVFGRSAASVPPEPRRNLPTVQRGPQNVRLQNMVKRIQRQQQGGRTDPTAKVARREGELIVNGGFDQIGADDDGLRGQFGETMFAPGSKRLTGWSIANAMVGLRDNPESPAGAPILELGPRDEPGAIAQRVKTERGRNYELSFLAAGGRNNQIKARAAEKEETIDCPDPMNFKRVRIPFRATDAESEVVISGVGNQGFGPMIDDVSVVSIENE